MPWWIWLIIGLVIFGVIGSNKEKEEKSAVKKVEHEEMVRRRKDAEEYIMASGDKQAIMQLKLAQANPSNYVQTLSQGMNSGNSTLKTALGVMAGVAIGSMIADAVMMAQINNALQSMQAQFNQIDGDLMPDVSTDGDADGDGDVDADDSDDPDIDFL
jgi:hypothetical protein